MKDALVKLILSSVWGQKVTIIINSFKSCLFIFIPDFIKNISLTLKMGEIKDLVPYNGIIV